MQTFVFDVLDMTCGGCTGSVQRMLGKIDGVSHAEATLRPGVVTVAADPARVTAARIEAVIAQLGYAALLRPARHTEAARPQA